MHANSRSANRAALWHALLSLLVLTLAIALAPDKFARAGAWLGPLLLALWIAGAWSARAAVIARARHGITVPGWSLLDRNWWAWDPPFRAFHWAMCACGLLVAWCLIAVSIAVQTYAAHVPASLAQNFGAAMDFAAALIVVLGGFLLTRHWARTPA